MRLASLETLALRAFTHHVERLHSEPGAHEERETERDPQSSLCLPSSGTRYLNDESRDDPYRYLTAIQ